MNAADWAEIAQMTGSNAVALYGNLITLMSGYLVVAYLVGEKLTRVQVAIVNSLYVINGLSIIVSRRQITIDAMEARYEAHLSVPNHFTAADPSVIGWAATVLAMIDIGLIIASLYFMWRIRHPKIE